ncbi:MAG: Lrp/AsnC family transcriptional regulator [Candidatus Woesearchaeota archaeon]
MLEKELLFVVSELADTRLQDIARTLRWSAQRVHYAIKALEKKGVLGSAFSVIDYSYFGQLLFRVYCRGAYIREKDRDQLLVYLQKHACVVALYEMDGEYDLVIEMCAPNPSHFYKELRDIIEKYPSLQRHDIVLNIVTYLYPRSYLVKKEYAQLPSHIIIGGDRTLYTLSKQEILFLQHLVKDPLANIRSLTKRTSMHSVTIHKMRKELQEQKILRATKYIVHHQSIGLLSYRIFLQLHNLTNEKEQELRDFLLHTKEVVRMHKTIGSWHMEIDIESFDRNRIRHFSIHLREDFKDIIASYNSIEWHAFYKRTYLPQYLFDVDT